MGVNRMLWAIGIIIVLGAAFMLQMMKKYK